MKEIILVKYGEIALKGLNKSTFEDMLQKNIKRRLKKLGTFEFYRRQSTIYITPPEGADIDEVINRLQKIFGISAIQRCAVFPKDFRVIAENTPEYLREALEGAADIQGGVQAQRQGVPDENSRDTGGAWRGYPRCVPEYRRGRTRAGREGKTGNTR